MTRKWAAVAAFLLLLFPLAARAQQDDSSFKLPAGTTLEIRLMNTLSTRINQEGDPFTGRIVEPFFARGEEVLPVGSTLEGRVTFVKDPGRVTGKAQMRLLAESITTPQNMKYTIVAALEDTHGADGATVKDKEGTIQGAGKDKKAAAKEAGIATGIGAGVGAIAAGGKGSLYGAGIGLLASTIHSIAKRGRDVTLPQGTELTFVVSRDSIAQPAQPAPAVPSPPER